MGRLAPNLTISVRNNHNHSDEPLSGTSARNSRRKGDRIHTDTGPSEPGWCEEIQNSQDHLLAVSTV